MNRAQLLGSVFLLMGLGQAGIATRVLLDGETAAIGVGYLLVSAVVVVLSLIAIGRPEWVDTGDLADQGATWGDFRIVAGTVLVLLATAFIGYSFTSWFT